MRKVLDGITKVWFNRPQVEKPKKIYIKKHKISMLEAKIELKKYKGK